MRSPPPKPSPKRADPLRSSTDSFPGRPGEGGGGGGGDEPEEALRSRYVVADLPVRLPATRPPVDRPNPRMGVSLAAWSPDGAFVATRCDAAPAVAWVWDSGRLELAAALVHAGPVRALAWEPAAEGRPRLAVAAGAGRLHLWTPAGASCVRIPVPGFKALGLRWNEDGSALLIAGKEAFCCAYFGGGAA
jgi:hypothetical protein